jgi:hypothetical protein
MEALLAMSRLPTGVSAALKVVLLALELLVIGAGVYVFPQRESSSGPKAKKLTRTRRPIFGWQWSFSFGFTQPFSLRL